MSDVKTWPTPREKTDLAGQFEELRRERDEWKHKAEWLHGKYVNEEAKVADQMDRAEAAEAEVKELAEELRYTEDDRIHFRTEVGRLERELDEAQVALESKELAVQEKTCSECQRECEIENRILIAKVERLTRERDYAIAQWVRKENQSDTRVRNGHRAPWTADEMRMEADEAARK